MSTRSDIIQIGDRLIRQVGVNAFSYYDISRALGIKNASVHYHFPAKTDLVVAIINYHTQRLEELKEATKNKDPLEKLRDFLNIYFRIKQEGNICLVGSLASDIYSVDEAATEHVKTLVDNILCWVISILQEGSDKGIFKYPGTARTRALMLVTNMIASLQLTRLTKDEDFETIKNTIIKDLQA